MSSAHKSYQYCGPAVSSFGYRGVTEHLAGNLKAKKQQKYMMHVRSFPMIRGRLDVKRTGGVVAELGGRHREIRRHLAMACLGKMSLD
jgi:hypothetical protein